MAKKEERFEVSYKQEKFTTGVYILVDRQTGVNYLYFTNSQGGGLTPLLDSRGDPVITPVSYYREYQE